MPQGDMVIYNECKRGLLAGEVDLDSHVINVAFVTGYTPNIDTHDGWADISSFEVSGGGYSAGGKSLTGKVVTEDQANDRGKFDAGDLTWTGLSVGTPSHAIIYDDTHATKILIAYVVITTATNGGDYTLAWNALGIVLLT